MFEKSLHASNIAASFAIVVTAADLTITGGAATAISAALSTISIFKKSDKAVKDLAKTFAPIMEETLETLPAERRKLIVQLLERHHLSQALILEHATDPAPIAAAMRTKAEAQENDPALTHPEVLDSFETVICRSFAKLMESIEAAEGMQFAMVRRLLIQSKVSGEAKKLADAGIEEQAIIKLAQTFSAKTNNLSQAWAELQNAMEIAVRVQAEGAGGSNHGDFVDEVLRRVAALSAEGSYAEAGEAIEAALAEEDAAHERRVERLLGSGIELAMLEGDAEKAASLLIRRADHAAGGQAGVAALRAIRRDHYEEGRDKGLAQPLEIAIALARQSLPRATDANERGTLQNDLGLALQALGQRENTTERLEQAVTAYRAALKEWTRDRVPLGWAATQSNLGNALQTLGERESSTERLEQAVTAFRAALKERTRDRVPLDWAGTQGNLANVEIAYFEKTGDPTHLTAARAHVGAALKVFTEAGATQYIGMSERQFARITALETS